MIFIAAGVQSSQHGQDREIMRLSAPVNAVWYSASFMIRYMLFTSSLLNGRPFSRCDLDVTSSASLPAPPYAQAHIMAYEVRSTPLSPKRHFANATMISTNTASEHVSEKPSTKRGALQDGQKNDP